MDDNFEELGTRLPLEFYRFLDHCTTDLAKIKFYSFLGIR
jgi:hypothetical protein